MLTHRTWTADLALLAARVVLGVIFVAHGAQKLFTYTIDGTAGAFAGMGVPAPQAAATVATFVELLGGAALLLGVATTVTGIVLTLHMLAATVLVHAPFGLFVENNGFELVAALGVGALLLAALGAGRLSVDHLVSSRRARGAVTEAREDAEPAATIAR